MLINVPRLRLRYRSTGLGAWCVCTYTAKGAWHSGWFGTPRQAISVMMQMLASPLWAENN